MDITFADKKLEQYANNDKKRNQKLGHRRSKLYKLRLDQLDTAETLEVVRYLPGKYHELKEDRKGQWACDLDHPYKLIFEPKEKPIPTDPDGKYIWVEIVAVEIIEINDYH